jgi:beta-lactamase regulating signal transducer with metallopeptidase domain
METEILKIASSQGVWACLSVILIFYIIRAQEKRDIEQEQREKNYQDIISKLTDKFDMLEDIKNNIIQIDDYVKNETK